jgi:mRNA interferase MazF
MKRGELYYIEPGHYTGSEQASGRPAIIVSNDKCNLSSEVVEVVFLTTAPKVDLPTHVTIRSTVKPSTALCEQVTSVSSIRVGSYIGKCTDVEMEAINQAIAISLDIERSTPRKVNTIIRSEHKEVPETDALVKRLEIELAVCKRERDMFENMYDKLLDKITK